MSGRRLGDMQFALERSRHSLLAIVTLAFAILAIPASAQAQSEVVEYYGMDELGSVRIVFDANGNVLGRMDYGPFGDELVPSTGRQQSIYAGLFTDGEAGLDHADARSYQSRTGRFSSVDPVYGGSSDPQSWNRYTYALNNPVQFGDPSGLLSISTSPNCDWREFICAPDSYSAWLFSGIDRGRGKQGGPGSNRGEKDPNNPRDPRPPTDPVPPTNPPKPPPPPPPPAKPPGRLAWWLTAGKSFFTGFGQAQVDAWNSDYYSCVVGSVSPYGLTGAVASKGVEETVLRSSEHGASRIAGAYYHFTDGRFTAWGKYSKVLVPGAAEEIASFARAFSALGWLKTDIELYEGIHECSGLLAGNRR